MESRGGPILAFKRLTTAAITIAWIELLRRIRKRQFDLSPALFEIAVFAIWERPWQPKDQQQRQTYSRRPSVRYAIHVRAAAPTGNSGRPMQRGRAKVGVSRDSVTDPLDLPLRHLA